MVDDGEFRTKVLGADMLFPARGGFGSTGVPATGEQCTFQELAAVFHFEPSRAYTEKCTKYVNCMPGAPCPDICDSQNSKLRCTGFQDVSTLKTDSDFCRAVMDLHHCILQQAGLHVCCSQGK